MKKTLSIIIPTVGKENRIVYLNRMLDSIFRQSVPFDEIIIFDNSGKQNIQCQVNEQYNNHLSIKWYSSPRQLPITESYRTAASYCSCDYMTIQGDDDELSPDFSAEVHAKMQNDPGVILAPFEYMDENGNDLPVYERFPLKAMPFKAFMHKDLNIMMGALIFSKKNYLSTAGFQNFCYKGLYMDWILFWEMAIHCETIPCIQTYVIRYRRNPEWTGRLRNLDEFEKFCASLAKIEQYTLEFFIKSGYSKKDCSFIYDLCRSRQLFYQDLENWGMGFSDIIFACLKKHHPKMKFTWRDRIFFIRRAFQDLFRIRKEKQ